MWKDIRKFLIDEVGVPAKDIKVIAKGTTDNWFISILGIQTFTWEKIGGILWIIDLGRIDDLIIKYGVRRCSENYKTDFWKILPELNDYIRNHENCRKENHC